MAACGGTSFGDVRDHRSPESTRGLAQWQGDRSRPLARARPAARRQAGREAAWAVLVQTYTPEAGGRQLLCVPAGGQQVVGEKDARTRRHVLAVRG